MKANRQLTEAEKKAESIQDWNAELNRAWILGLSDLAEAVRHKQAPGPISRVKSRHLRAAICELRNHLNGVEDAKAMGWPSGKPGE